MTKIVDKLDKTNKVGKADEAKKTDDNDKVNKQRCEKMRRLQTRSMRLQTLLMQIFPCAIFLTLILRSFAYFCTKNPNFARFYVFLQTFVVLNIKTQSFASAISLFVFCQLCGTR